MVSKEDFVSKVVEHFCCMLVLDAEDFMEIESWFNGDCCKSKDIMEVL